MTSVKKKNNRSDDGAIDFLQMMREEKRQARQQRKKNKPANSNQNKTEASKVTSITTAASIAPQAIPVIPVWRHGDSLSTSSFPQLDSEQHRISAIDTIYYIPEFLSEPHQGHLLEWLQALPEDSTESSNNARAVNPKQARWNRMRYGKRRVALFSTSETTKTKEDEVLLPTQVQYLCKTLVDTGGMFAPETTRKTDFKEKEDSLTLLPQPLQDLCDTLVQTGIFTPQHKPNHILLNEYQPGQGILPHTDGPVYHPITATLSIGQSSVLLQFLPRLATHDIGINSNDDRNDQVKPQVLLEGNGSLVVFADDAYTHYTHGIHDDIEDETSSDQCVNAASGTLVQRGYRISLTFRHKL